MKSFELMGEALLARNEGQRQMAATTGQALKRWVARRVTMLQEMRAERHSRRQMVKELSSLTDRGLWEWGSFAPTSRISPTARIKGKR